MKGEDIILNKGCVFALISTWNAIYYGIIKESYTDTLGTVVYRIYNKDENRWYEREAKWIRQS